MFNVPLHSLTKLVGALIKGHRPYTKGIAKLYDRVGENSAENRRALDQMARGKKTRMTFGVMNIETKIKRALEILTINY